MSWAHLPAAHFVHAAEAIAPMNLGEREAIERDRGLSFDLFRTLRNAGFFSLWVPKSIGGPELTPPDLARIVETISRADGSVGWLVGIATSNSGSRATCPDRSRGRFGATA